MFQIFVGAVLAFALDLLFISPIRLWLAAERKLADRSDPVPMFNFPSAHTVNIYQQWPPNGMPTASVGSNTTAADPSIGTQDTVDLRTPTQSGDVDTKGH